VKTRQFFRQLAGQSEVVQFRTFASRLAPTDRDFPTDVKKCGSESSDNNSSHGAQNQAPPQHFAGASWTLRPWIIFSVFLLSALALAASFVVQASATSVVRHGVTVPVSTTPNAPVEIASPRVPADNLTTNLTIHLDVRMNSGALSGALFHIGPPVTGLSVQLTPSVTGTQNITLTTQLGDGVPFMATLVKRVIPGANYALTITVRNQTEVAGLLDGSRVFAATFPEPEINPVLSNITVGGGPTHTAAFTGSVTAFRLAFQQIRPSEPAVYRSVLRVFAACLAFLGCVLLLILFASSVFLPRVDHDIVIAPTPRFRPSHSRSKRWGALAGVALFAVGVALVWAATPTDNFLATQTGVHRTSVRNVDQGDYLVVPLSGVRRSLHGTSSFDLDLSFQLRLDSLSSATPALSVVESTLHGAQGMSFQMVATGSRRSLTVTTGGRTPLLNPVTQLLVNDFPLHRWVTISAVIRHNQSYVYSVDGQTIQSFTWNSSILNVAPTHLLVDSHFGGAIRATHLTVTAYRSPSDGSFWFIRVTQILGMLCVVLGIALLARRYLSRLIPASVGLRRPLVLIAFATTGLGIAFNVFIDLLHLQQSSSPYYDRNSWLASQYPRFNDFFQVLQLIKAHNPYGIAGGNYPPFGYWVVSPFIGMTEYASLFIFLSMATGFILWWFSRVFTSGLRTAERIGIVIVAILSLPVTFAFDRGNIDIIAFVMVVFGIAAVERERFGLAATWIGLAAAAKIFPVLYLLALIRRGKMRYLVVGALVIAGVTVCALLGFDGTLSQNVRSFVAIQRGMESATGDGVSSTYYNASFAGFAQVIGYVLNSDGGATSVMKVVAPLMVPLEVAAVLALAWYLRHREDSLWRSLTLITITFLLFTDLSNYYALLFLFIPLSLFLKEAIIDRHSATVAVLFGCTIAPHSYFYFGSFVDFSVLTTAPLLLALGILVIRDGSRERSSIAVPLSKMSQDPQIATLSP
jgi:hypothetical protein